MKQSGGFGRIHLAQLLTLAALIVVTAVAMVPLQRALNERMLALKSELIATVEATLGRSISYSAISPSVFRYLDVRELKVLGDPGERDILIDIGRVKAYYSIFRLFSDQPLNAVTELRLENSTLDLDYVRDQDVLAFVHQVMQTNGQRYRDSASPAPIELRLRGDNMRVHYRGPDAEYRADGLGFVAQLNRGALELALRGSFEYRNQNAGSLIARDAFVHGTLDGITVGGQLTVDVPRVETPVATVVNQTFLLDYDGRQLDVRKVRDRSPIDLGVVIDLRSGMVQVDFQADGMIPADVLTLHGALAVFNPWLLGETSGRGQLSYTLDTQQLTYDLNVSNRVRNPDVPEPLTLQAEVRGDMRRARIERFIVRSGQGQALFQGALDLDEGTPHGKLLFEGFGYDGIGPVTAAFALSGEGGGWTVARAEQLSYDRSRFFDVELAMRRDGGTTLYSAAAFLDARRSGWLEVNGVRSSGAGGATEIVAEFRNAAIDGVLEVAADLVPGLQRDPLRAVLGGTVLDTRVHAGFAGDRLRVEAPFVSLYQAQRPDRYAAFGFYLGDHGFEVRDAVVGSGDYLLRGGLFGRATHSGQVDFSAELHDGQNRYALEGLVDRQRTVAFRGSHGLDGRIHIGNGGEVVYSVRGSDVPLPFSSNGARLAFDLSGMYRSLNRWDAHVRSMELSGLTINGRSAHVALRGRFNAFGGRIDQLAYQDAVSRISGSGRAEYDLFGNTVSSLELELIGAETPERYELQAMFDRGEITAALVFERSPLTRSAVEGIRGAVNGVMTIDGSVSEPRMTADFQVVDGALRNDAFSANGRVAFSESVVTFDSIRGQYVTHSLSAGHGTIDLRSSTIDLQATIRNNARHRAQPRTLHVRSQLESPDGERDLRTVLSGPFHGVVQIDGLDLLPARYGDWHFAIDRNEERITVSGGPSNAVHAVVQSSGQFRVEALDPLPIRFIAAGTLQDGEIEANVTQILVQIDEVPDLFDLRALTIYAGRISGGIRLLGPLNDPDLYGTLTADAVKARLEYLSEPIGPAKMFLVLQEKQLQLTPFEAAVGRGVGTLSGTIVLHRWTVDEFQLDIQTDAVGVPVTYTFGGLNVDGHGVGRMRISGSPGFTSITGDIEARATTLAVTPRDEPREPDGETMTTIDLTLRTGRRVEFLWPSREFPVVRSFAQANERLRLQYSDEAGTFRLRGNVGIQGGEIYYFDRSFYIREGSIAFDETEELFDPRLRARAELREVGREGPVRIFLIADGSRLSEFSPRFESSPTMTDSEIASLIGGSLITGGPDDVFNISTAMLATTDIVTPFGIMNTVESSIRDALRLDLFSVRTQLFQNLVVGALEDTADQPLDNTAPSLGQYLDNTTVFLGKYLGSSLFLELLVQIRARNPLEPEGQSIGGIEVDSELGLEFQTPFFNLQWSIFPQNPQTLFVTDTTFSFSWGFSY
ncbi:MAG: hypothetical protein EA384_04610 [Spirochaetaceae bacterium]|nr:MAG: hypothetical protein EA384_04610 [Spirochaetaceae bacterium]